MNDGYSTDESQMRYAGLPDPQMQPDFYDGVPTKCRYCWLCLPRDHHQHRLGHAGDAVDGDRISHPHGRAF